ncbi:DinB family protein [Tropicimonas sp. S265A]|uniref:DinB family protein n=1 Tax=Tropicimonas sp. S265A TaxID=3415134 RepID=UPI003C7E0DF9
MITPGYCHMMARYNAWQNESLISAAAGLPVAELTKFRGAHFGSIFATFNHLLWGDTIWMSRFAEWDKPEGGIASSVEFTPSWAVYLRARREADRQITDWAGRLDAEALEGTLGWFSGALNQQVERPFAVCVAHFFNHQTHHRGQIHAMLTAAGARPGDTDLFAMPEGL